MKWIAIIEGIALIACIVKCIGNKLAADALAYYMSTKGYTPPTRQELRACIDYVANRTFQLRPK